MKKIDFSAHFFSFFYINSYILRYCAKVIDINRVIEIERKENELKREKNEHEKKERKSKLKQA